MTVVIYAASVACPGCHQSVHLWTDQHTAWAVTGNPDTGYPNHGIGADPDKPGSLAVLCGGYYLPAGRDCTGVVTFDLTIGRWFPANPVLAAYLALGTNIGA